MIPRDFITAWRSEAPWVQDRQVEQDLVISRALVELFAHPLLADGLAFRGGTALYKLHLRPAARYSEDIDLVQVHPGAIGPFMDAIHAVLDPWLGLPRRKQTDGRVTLVYRFLSDEQPPVSLRLKIEVNVREHFAVYPLERRGFEVASRWFRGAAHITTYDIDELLATKLRALYQRKKGRDLFDLALALERQVCAPERVAETFCRYMREEGATVSRALVEQNLAAKARDPMFSADMSPLLAAGFAWEPSQAFHRVQSELVALLPGAPWRG